MLSHNNNLMLNLILKVLKIAETSWPSAMPRKWLLPESLRVDVISPSSLRTYTCNSSQSLALRPESSPQELGSSYLIWFCFEISAFLATYLVLKSLFNTPKPPTEKLL